MDFSSKSPKKEFSKDIASKIEIPKYSDKILKSPDEKSNQKPNTKAKNKIERPKIDQLKEELIHRGLIKKNFSEFFNFDVQNKKDDEEKQLDLGHFLNL